MNKKLIAVALAALPVAAMADVTIYGTLSGGLEHDTYSAGAPSQNKVEDYTSLIGFKGSEDLGNGLKTVWQVESRFNLDGTGTSTLATRQTFVGLDGGNLGLIRMGHLNTVENDQYSVDQWSDGTGVNGLQLFDSGSRLNNAIRYDSASFAGFSGAIGYGFGEDATTGVSSSDVLTYGVNYNTPLDGLALHYAGNYDTNPTAQGSQGRKANTNLFEADYSQGNLFLSGAYKWATGYDFGNAVAKDDAAAWVGLKTHQIALSAAYSFGAIKPKISYAKGWNGSFNGSTIQDSGYTQYVVGVDYALSKRTTVGVAYGHMSQGAYLSQTASTANVPAVSTTSVQMSTSF